MLSYGYHALHNLQNVCRLEKYFHLLPNISLICDYEQNYFLLCSEVNADPPKKYAQVLISRFVNITLYSK